jgi:hypothetical protein
MALCHVLSQLASSFDGPSSLDCALSSTDSSSFIKTLTSLFLFCLLLQIVDTVLRAIMTVSDVMTVTGTGTAATTAIGETNAGMTGAPATKTLGTVTTHATDAVMRKIVAQGVETLLGTLEMIVDAVNIRNVPLRPNGGHPLHQARFHCLNEDARHLVGM